MLLLRSLVDGPSVTQASETGSFLTQDSIKPYVGFTACRVPSEGLCNVQASYSFYSLDEEMELPICETACPSFYWEQEAEL